MTRFALILLVATVHADQRRLLPKPVLTQAEVQESQQQAAEDLLRQVVKLREMFCMEDYLSAPWYQRPFLVNYRRSEWPARVFVHHFENPCKTEAKETLRRAGLLYR